MKLRNCILCVMGVLSLTACHSNKNTDENEVEINEFTANLTSKDTADVMGLVSQYLTYASQEKYEEAAAMLYKPDSDDVWNEPVLLDNDELHRVSKTLSLLPTVSFQIDSLRFNSAIDNAVWCTVFMADPDGEHPTPSRHMAFKPMNYLGGWRLCLQDGR